MQKFAIEKKDLKNRSKESFVNDLHDLHFLTNDGGSVCESVTLKENL